MRGFDAKLFIYTYLSHILYPVCSAKVIIKIVSEYVDTEKFGIGSYHLFVIPFA